MAAARARGWSLLPLIAADSLGLGAGGYGLLLAAVGVGAGGLRGRLGVNGMLAAVVLVALATVHVTRVAVVVLLPAGPAWIGVLSTLDAAVRTRLPGWVRARGLAVHLLVSRAARRWRLRCGAHWCSGSA
ncbi:MFS transporter [Streptomyces sp. NPDC019531]|uniref:MFS transporter n=1 Tax=Streptomyces sp. NPDC019531 TaxID=3365062 RepID=UPI00384D4D12